MIFTDFSNDYYLAGNDIWLKVSDFLKPAVKLELTCENITTSKTLNPLILYIRPDNTFSFNISQPVRSLFAEPNHLANNNLQAFRFTFKFFYEDATTETSIQNKYFVRGFATKQERNSWNLDANTELVVGKWCEWTGLTLPGFAQKLQSSQIVSFIPTEKKILHLKNCEYKIVKFLNSLGGYQYWVFEYFEIKPKTKPMKRVSRIPYSLSQNAFRNIGSEIEETIELKTQTPSDVQSVILDLIKSHEIFIYNGFGLDDDSKWTRLALDSNDAVFNNIDKAYENKLSFSFINNISNQL